MGCAQLTHSTTNDACNLWRQGHVCDFKFMSAKRVPTIGPILGSQCAVVKMLCWRQRSMMCLELAALLLPTLALLLRSWHAQVTLRRSVSLANQRLLGDHPSALHGVATLLTQVQHR